MSPTKECVGTERRLWHKACAEATFGGIRKRTGAFCDRWLPLEPIGRRGQHDSQDLGDAVIERLCFARAEWRQIAPRIAQATFLAPA